MPRMDGELLRRNGAYCAMTAFVGRAIEAVWTHDDDVQAGVFSPAFPHGISASHEIGSDSRA